MSRSRRVAALAVLFVLALSVLWAPLAAAATDSVMVVVLEPAGVFEVGSTVTLGVRVFDFGSAVDPTGLTLDIWGAASSRSLSYVRQGAGSYSATFQIASADLAGDNVDGIDEVVIWANATVDGIAYNTRGTVRVYSVPALQLLLGPLPMWVLPGTSVVVNATVLAGLTPTDPTSLSLWSYLQTPLGGLGPQFPLPVTRLGPGLYSGSYHVPDSAPQDSILSVGGEVTLGTNQAYANYVDAKVGVPHAFVIWQHQRALTSTYALVDILVANDTGWPVAGADVSLTYAFFQTCGMTVCEVPRWLYGHTDRLGAASFNLTYAEWAYTVQFPIQGNVSVGALNQTYAGAVFSPEPTFYPDLCPESPLLTYAPGDQMARTYHGACGRFSSPNQTYYYYASTAQAIVANGSVRSDSRGNFTLTFNAPERGFLIFLFTNTSLGWIRYMDYVPVADPALLHVKDLDIGKVANVTVDEMDAGGVALFLPHGAFDPVNPNAPGAHSTSGWYPLSCCTFPETVPPVPGAPFHQDLVIPRFLPKDHDYRFTVAVNWSAFGGYSYAYAELIHVTNVPPIASATFSTLGPASEQPVVANASSSTDPDGLLVAYAMDWGDGNSTGWMDGPEATHAYAAGGTYTVTIRVRDDTGAVNATTYFVVVEGTILGVRASTFYLVALVAGMAAVAAVGVALYLRRMRRRLGESHGPKNLQTSIPPGEPPAPGSPKPPPRQ